MQAGFREQRFATLFEPGENNGSSVIDIAEQPFVGFFEVGREGGVLLRDIAFEGRRRFPADPFQARDKDGLVGSEVSDVFEYAPFIGQDAALQGFDRQAGGEVPDGTMLVH